MKKHQSQTTTSTLCELTATTYNSFKVLQLNKNLCVLLHVCMTYVCSVFTNPVTINEHEEKEHVLLYIVTAYTTTTLSLQMYLSTNC